MAEKLTEAEFKTLKVILARGGYKGEGHMGRLSKKFPIRKTTLRRLVERGLVEVQPMPSGVTDSERLYAARLIYQSDVNPVSHVYMKFVTAKGCVAVHEHEQREQFAALKKEGLV